MFNWYRHCWLELLVLLNKASWLYYGWLFGTVFSRWLDVWRRGAWQKKLVLHVTTSDKAQQSTQLHFTKWKVHMTATFRVSDNHIQIWIAKNYVNMCFSYQSNCIFSECSHFRCHIPICLTLTSCKDRPLPYYWIQSIMFLNLTKKKTLANFYERKNC